MQPKLRRRLFAIFKPRQLVLIFFVALIAALCITAFIIFQRLHLTPSSLWHVLIGSSYGVKQQNERTNIAILGMGGKEHDGGYLTDSILIMSLDLKNNDHSTISLPRDIWIESLKDRINTAYHTGEEKADGGGMILAKSVIEEVSGLPIHYGVVLDFEGFIQIIDVVGGVDVTIEEGFTDTLYPIKGKENDLCNGDKEYACRFETVTFTKGKEHMNGERALKYVRSRHSEGDTGNDFSRGKRQQAVLFALKNKLLTQEVFTDITALKHVSETINATVKSDINTAELLLLGRSFMKSNGTFRSIALSQELPEKKQKGLLINPPLAQYEGKWVLLPKHESFEQIHKYIACMIENIGSCEFLIE